VRCVDYITVNAQEWRLVAQYLAGQPAGRRIAKTALLMLVEDHFLFFLRMILSENRCPLFGIMR
jgi:hypothetical protein